MIRRRNGMERHRILYCCGPSDDIEEMKSKIHGIVGPAIDLIVVQEFEKLAGNSGLVSIIK